jgi:hypothetical protein
MSDQPSPIRGTAAGVPFLAFPPLTPRQNVPIVAAWHLMDAPRSEAAFAAAVPLDGLDAWRVYFGLPETGARLPEGGWDEIMRRGYTDAVMLMHGPVISRGAEEFPAALADFERQLDIRTSALGLMGGSAGAAIALLVLAEVGPAAGLAVDAAVGISPVSQLYAAVGAMGRVFGVEYPWSEESLAVAHRSDYVARADEIAATGAAVRLVLGADDDKDGFLLPAERLSAAIAERAGDSARSDVVVVDGMAHALAEEPGLEPAPQTAAAVTVDRHAVEWFARHLEGTRADQD